MARAKNVLWIMCDQLRYDYLGCTGHPTLKTPNIDAMARRGVLFSKAYVQSPICGPSRMSFYTGRYCRSHGATWNGFPRAAWLPDRHLGRGRIRAGIRQAFRPAPLNARRLAENHPQTLFGLLEPPPQNPP